MKYIILHKDEVTSNIIDSLGDGYQPPQTIWLVDPPSDTPGGTPSKYVYLRTAKSYVNELKDFKKLNEEEFNSIVQDIKNGKHPNYKITEAVDKDPSGRAIFRSAATIKGWHYQAHSIQFEVNKLNSIYNKDADENDLGFAELKIYDASGSECTTQLSADTNGVKTVVTWKPDFDFEIISGNVRQATKESIDSYVHVRLQSATGFPAPHDWFVVPFTQGGINLKYIGADEVLKTDGRASKLVKAGTNGDYFEVIINYEANVLTNNNRHEMSVIFEIYKDPTS